ncbi:invasion associated locus B family protein [Mesorhizobium sp. BHbdii]
MNYWLWELGLSRLRVSRLGLSRTLANVIFLAAVSSVGLSGVGLSSQANAAQPSGKVRSTHGAWSIICDTPAGATSEQCVMMQNVVAEDRPEMGLSVVVLRTADNKAEILRVLAPLGVLLPNGLGLNVDGKDIGRAYFVRCFQDGCYAEVILEKPLLDTLKTGTSATFIVFQTPEEGIGIPVELKGFADGFAALP